MSAPTSTPVDARTLVPERTFAKLTARIGKDHPELAADLPGRIMDQALAFLATCAVSPRRLGPSELVDIGWHTFVLYTRDYAESCDRVAGRFIHHVPEDAGDRDRSAVPVVRAVRAVRAAGYTVDEAVWRGGLADCTDSSDGGGGKCTQCYAGCHDSP